MAGENAAMKLVRESSEDRGIADVDDNIVYDKNNIPMFQISCAAAELIPTRQYANVTVGPIVVKKWIPIDFNGFTEAELVSMKRAAREIQNVCEEAVAEDRQSVHTLIRQSDGGRVSE